MDKLYDCGRNAIELGIRLEKLIELLFSSRFVLKVDIDHKPFFLGEFQREHHKAIAPRRQGSCALRQAFHCPPEVAKALGSVSLDH